MNTFRESRNPGTLSSDLPPPHNPAAEIWFGFGESPLGLVLVARSAAGLRAVLLGDEREALRRDLQRRFPASRLIEGGVTPDPLIGDVLRLLEAPGDGSRSATDLPLDLAGTEFQQCVWQALREIPAGSTASYGEIARRIGRPAATRAVAQACAANPLAVIIPCHRVVRGDGTLSGYRWGIERKRVLLENEAAACSPGSN